MKKDKNAITLIKSEIAASESEIEVNLTDIEKYKTKIAAMRENLRELEIINVEKKIWINSLKSSLSKLED